MNCRVLPHEWSCDLMESDRRYFEAGADVIPVAGAVIALMPGAEALAAGCVVHRMDPAYSPPDAEEWLADVEQRLRELGRERVRVYLEAPHPPLEEGLAERGYRARMEVGFVRRAGGDGDAAIELELAADEQGWRERAKLIERVQSGPDGYDADPDLWVWMERRKQQAGYLQPYLIIASGSVAGAVCSAASGSILRLKNLIVDPDLRRRGIATAAASSFARLAADEGYSGAGVFALEGAPSMRAYQNAGYYPVTQQTEWARDIKDTL